MSINRTLNGATYSWWFIRFIEFLISWDIVINERPKGSIWTIWHQARTTDTQWRHKSKKSEFLGRCGRQNMVRPYLKIWDWDLIFGRAVKEISSPGVRSPWVNISKFNAKSKIHGLRTPGEEIAFTAQQKIKYQSQIFRYGRSIFCLPHRLKILDFFDLCLHWVSVVHVLLFC